VADRPAAPNAGAHALAALNPPITIACDFDGTCSLDPVGFRDVCRVLRERGHTVLLVTQRCEQYRAEIERCLGPLALMFDAVVWASGKTKEEACREAGYVVHIWIEDAPYSVYTPMRYRGCPD
jgi:hypothetical protein